MTRSEVEEATLGLVLQKFDALTEVVAALDDLSANRELPCPGSNSLIQLLAHCCGAMRRWSSTVNLGRPVPRDREAEFTVRLPVADALELAARTREAFCEDVEATDFGAAPRSLPPGRDEFWATTCHGVLLHVLEELSQHLGHAEITRDVLTAGLSR